MNTSIKLFVSLITVLFLLLNSGCAEWRSTKDWLQPHPTKKGFRTSAHIVDLDSQLTHSTFSTIDIRQIETIYCPIRRNIEWDRNLNEFVSQIPSEPGKMVIHTTRRNAFKNFNNLYKIDLDQKAICFMSTSHLYESFSYEFDIEYELMIPTGVKIVFYEDLTETRFYSKEDREKEKVEMRTKVHFFYDYIGMAEVALEICLKNHWTLCEEEPTEVKHLPGIVVPEKPRQETKPKKIHLYLGLQKKIRTQSKVTRSSNNERKNVSKDVKNSIRVLKNVMHAVLRPYLDIRCPKTKQFALL